MDEVTPKTAEEFGFKANSVRKLKYMYICRGDRETRVIKKTSLDEKRIMMVYDFKEHLFKNGFYHTDKYFMSVQGVPYYSDGENMYVMTDFIDMNEASFADSNHIKRILSETALFHKAGKNFPFENRPMEEGSILHRLESGIKRLCFLRRCARNKKHISDIDIMFIKNFDNIYKKAEKALEIAKRIEFKNTYTVCHNSLKEETLSVSKNVFITGMDTLSRDSFVVDIADILERYMRKHDEKFLSIEKLISSYSSVNAIDSCDMSLLYALLLFPFGYIKVSENLYSKNRKWLPIGVSQKFKSMLAMQDKNEGYISPIAVD